MELYNAEIFYLKFPINQLNQNLYNYFKIVHIYEKSWSKTELY